MGRLLERKSRSGLALLGAAVIGVLAFVLVSGAGTGRGAGPPAALFAAGPERSPFAGSSLTSVASERLPGAFGRRRRSAEPRLTASYRPTSVRLHGPHW